MPQVLLREIEQAEFATSQGRCLHLRVALDYSSRDAIAQAAAIAGRRHSHAAQGAPDHFRLTLAEALTEHSSDVDLLIRTGGEKRLSDFLLWESAYAELLFTDRMWPDFGATDLDAALQEFNRRQRRFGGLPGSVSNCAAPSLGGAR